MRIAEILGSVTLSRSHPSLKGASLRLAVPLSLKELTEGTSPQADILVVYDELGAGPGSRIALSESREASNPFYPEQKPVDAYNSAILDHINVKPL